MPKASDKIFLKYVFCVVKFYVKGETKMSTVGFLKGLITGAAVGGAAALIFDPITPRQRKRVKKQAYAMWRNMSAAADTLSCMRH